MKINHNNEPAYAGSQTVNKAPLQNKQRAY